MPNHITNRLTIIGEPTEVNNVLNAVKNDTSAIDFNKIIPMPEDLLIHGFGMHVENMIKNSLHIRPHENQLLAALEISNRQNTKSPLSLDDKDWNHFILGLNNMRKYGHIYWYDWAVKNWGTKWNAYGNPTANDNVITFETAWSGANDIVCKLSEQYPDLQFELAYADEDTGSNCGKIIYKNGVDVQSIFPASRSIEAYDLAFELNPERKDDYKLVGDTYEYIES